MNQQTRSDSAQSDTAFVRMARNAPQFTGHALVAATAFLAFVVVMSSLCAIRKASAHGAPDNRVQDWHDEAARGR